MPRRSLRRAANTVPVHASRSAGALAAVLLVAVFLSAAVARPAFAQKDEVEVFVAQAIVAYEEKRYDDALASLDRALAIDPGDVDALYYTGLVRIAQERLDQAAEVLERARTRSPKDEAVLFQLGVVYFSQARYDRAQPLLEQVFAARPGVDGLGYYVGFMRYRQKDYQGAVRAFRAGTSASPDIQQLSRFYTGLALAVLGLPEQAVEEIEAARNLQPASPLTGPAERLRDAVVSAREKERRFHAEVRLGFFYDDNVAVNPSAGRDPLAQILRQRNTSSTGEVAAVKFDYSFLRTGPWEATATFSFFTTYNNDLPSFNVVDYLGALTGTYRGTIRAMPFQVGLQYTYDYLTLDEAEFIQRHTVAPYFTLVENANNLTSFQVRYQNKQFSHDTNIVREEKRDADNWMAGFVHLFRFQGDKHFIKVGYQFDYDDTEGPNRRGLNYSYVGNRFIAGAQYTLPWLGIRLKYDFDVHLRDYQHKNTLFPVLNPGTKARYDTEFTHVIGAVIPLPYSLNLLVDYQAIRGQSNLDVFAYNRNVISAVLVWSY